MRKNHVVDLRSPLRCAAAAQVTLNWWLAPGPLAKRGCRRMAGTVVCPALIGFYRMPTCCCCKFGNRLVHPSDASISNR